MKCPKCGASRAYTPDSREWGTKQLRRRKCQKCGHRFKTVENIEPENEKNTTGSAGNLQHEV